MRGQRPWPVVGGAAVRTYSTGNDYRVSGRRRCGGERVQQMAYGVAMEANMGMDMAMGMGSCV